jgi:hypothetical protein
MKKYLIGLLIALAAGVTLLLLINQGFFTASAGDTKPSDDAARVADDTAEPVKEENAGAEEEIVVDAIEEEASGKESKPESGEGYTATDDAGFAITDSPFQDFTQAREKGEPIVLKFYSET